MMARLLRRAATALAVAVALCGGPAFAQGGDGREAAIADRPSDMAMGRLLFQKGRLGDAAVFLRQATPASDDEAIERALLLAIILKQQGDAEGAAQLLEAILTARPGNTAARLHLADSYMRIGQRDKVDYHLNVALRDRTLDPEVGETVDAYLDELRASERFSLSVSAGILPQTNASRRPSRPVVVSAGGVPLSFPEAESGVGLSLGGAGVFAPVLGEAVRGRFALSGAAQLYRDGDLNEVTVGGEAGVERLLPDGSLLGTVRGERTWLGDEGFRRTVGPVLAWRHDLSPSTEATLRLSAERRLHDDIPSRDGYAYGAGAFLSRSFGVRTLLNLDASVQRIDARAGDQSGFRLRFGSSVAHAFDGGLTLAGGVRLSLDRRDEDFSIFGEKRNDRLTTVTLRALHRALRYKGFAPFVEYAYENNASSIDLYEYDNHRVGFGVTRRF